MKKRMFFEATKLVMVSGLLVSGICSAAGSVSYTATGGVSLISINGKAGEAIQDTGVTKTETRKFPAYRSVAIDNFPGRVTVRFNGQSNAAVTADQAVLPAIRTAVENGTLFISLTKSIATQMPLQIFLNAESISSLQIDGVSDVVMEDVAADRLHLQLDGSGSITAAGKVAELEAVITGSGDLKLRGLAAEQCTVRIDGSGDAEVHVTGVLNAEIDGAGDIIYFGTFDGKMIGVDYLNGEKKWEFQTESSKENYEKIYNEDGNFKDGFELYGKDFKKSEELIHGLGSILSSPFVENGIIYFGSSDGNVYAVKLE